jgi:signal peptide peptidase SppA
MDMNKSYVLQAFVESPWAILPGKLAQLEEIVKRHAAGEKLEAAEIESHIHGATRPLDRRIQNVAVLPLFGTIFPRGNLMTEMSGATSAEKFGKQFTELLNDPAIDAIILDVNSPGGQVGGIPEVANKIFEARGKKPIVAVANHLTASGAFWIATAADEFVVSPSSDVGSIGVFMLHADYSSALEQEGIKVSFIKAGKYKTAGNPYQPLSEENRAYLQTGVDEVYDEFVAAIARHRGVSEEDVRNGFGEGGIVSARQAVEEGMADRIGTLEEEINRLLTKNGPFARSSASASENPEAGQEPASDRATNVEARARLASVEQLSITGEVTMYARELMNKREKLIARATEIVDAADKENRDMTEDERKEYTETLDQVEALAGDIKRIQAERDRLRESAEEKFLNTKAEKPDESKGDLKLKKRADFDKMTPEDQAAFVKSGGKVQD